MGGDDGHGKHRCFRIDELDIELLRDRRCDARRLEAYDRWVRNFAPRVDSVIDQLRQAFANITLRDETGGWGIGLWESQGLDDYASEAELEMYRRQDERLHWWKIPLEVLNHCHAGTWFMDVQGFVFHLPAFLIAELNDEHGYGFIDQLIRLPEVPQGWSDRLTPEQKKVLVIALRLIVEHPNYAPDVDAFRKKIVQLESALPTS